MSLLISQMLGQSDLLRNGMYRRKHAESMYKRNNAYNGGNQNTLNELEALLSGEMEKQQTQSFQARDAGQVKQVALPAGASLDERLELWKGVRRDAISIPVPKPADYQLAAQASTQIRKTEAQMTLHEQAKSTLDNAAEKAIKPTAMRFSLEAHPFIMQSRYEQAMASYAFHVQMKENGFEFALPRFHKIA